MKCANACKVLLIVAVLALCAAACADEPGAVDDGNVATTAEALGGFTELVNVGFESPMDIGTQFTVFRVQPGEASCGRVDVVQTQTGVRESVPALPGCANISAVSSQGRVLVSDQRGGSIYELVRPPVMAPMGGTSGGTPPPPPPWSWVPVANNNHATVSSMVVDSNTLYWHDSFLLHRVNLATGVESPNSPVSVAGTLLGNDGSQLYLDVFASSGNGSELHKATFTSTSYSREVLATAGQRFATWFSFDASQFYWVESSGGVNYLRRLSKGGGAVSTVKSSSGATFYTPLSNGSFLYWLEKSVSTGVIKIRRKNLSNSNIFETTFPFTWSEFSFMNRMKLLPSGIYFTPVFDSPRRWSLYRTAL
jgi:hypothetical protein